MPFATFVVAGDCTAPLKSTKPVHNVIVNVIVLISFLFACSSTKTALSTTCAVDESKRKTFWPQGYLQASENKRIHVNGCPRMGVIVFFFFFFLFFFFLLSFFQLKPTVYIVAARLDIILWRGVIIQSQISFPLSFTHPPTRSLTHSPCEGTLALQNPCAQR